MDKNQDPGSGINILDSQQWNTVDGIHNKQTLLSSYFSIFFVKT